MSDLIRRCRLLTCMTVLGMLAATSCSTVNTGETTSSLPDPALCGRILDEAPAETEDAPVVWLLWDSTGDQARQALAPAVRTALEEGQRKRQVLKIGSVSGAAPALTVPLDPAQGAETANADRLRGLVLDCLDVWLSSDAVRPTRPGSDILGALNAAARQRPGLLVIASNGLPNAGDLDLTALGFDVPADVVVDQLTERDVLPELAGVPVLWTALGETREQTLPEPVRRALQAMWTSVLRDAGAVPAAADGYFNSVTGTASISPDLAKLPADILPIPAVSAVTAPSMTAPPVDSSTAISPSVADQPTVVTVPAVFLFPPDEPALGPDADTTLSDVIDRFLTPLPPTAMIEVTGHTGGIQDDFAQQLSQQRADNVARRLAELGVPAAQLSATGRGSTALADPANPGSAVNRRVELTITNSG